MYVDRNVTECLNSIRVKKDAMCVGNICEFFYRLNRSNFIVCKHYGNKISIISNRFFQDRRKNVTFIINRKDCNGNPKHIH